MQGTTEKDPKRTFNKLLGNLGFEDPAAPASPPVSKEQAKGTKPLPATTTPVTPAIIPDTDPRCTLIPADASCKKCQGVTDATKCKLVVKSGEKAELPVPLNKLAKAPYALVIRN